MTIDEKQPEKATIQPAAAWPSYETDHARAELAAMQMLVAGVAHRTIRQRTRLSRAHISRLAELVAEEAKAPATPRNVLRERRPRRPVRIRVVEPLRDIVPSLEHTDPLPKGKPPGAREPEQLALIAI